MDKYATRLWYRRSLVSDSVMGALIAGMLALTACDDDTNVGARNDGGNTAAAMTAATMTAVEFQACRSIHRW